MTDAMTTAVLTKILNELPADAHIRGCQNGTLEVTDYENGRRWIVDPNEGGGLWRVVNGRHERVLEGATP